MISPFSDNKNERQIVAVETPEPYKVNEATTTLRDLQPKSNRIPWKKFGYAKRFQVYIYIFFYILALYS